MPGPADSRARLIFRIVFTMLTTTAGAAAGLAVSDIVWPDEVPGISVTAGIVAGFLLGRAVR